MPGPALQAKKLPQWGLETATVPGIPDAASVAATSKMAVQDFLIIPQDEVQRESILTGLIYANRGGEVISERRTDWQVPESPLSFNDFHYWMGMALPAPVKSGAGPFVWTSTLGPTALGTRHLRTFELQLDDGTNVHGVEVPSCFLKELEVAWAPNSLVKFSANGAGRRIATAAITGALALPALQFAPTALGKVFINDTFATMGNTQITGQVIGARFKLSTGIIGQVTVEGRANQDYSVAIINIDDIKWSIEVDLKGNLNTGQWQTERTAAEAQTLRAVQLQLSITGAVAYDLKIKALCKHTAGSLFPQGNQDGEITAKLALEGTADDVSPSVNAALIMAVTNNVTAAIS